MCIRIENISKSIELEQISLKIIFENAQGYSDVGSP